MNFLHSLKAELFEPNREISSGELIFFKFFELFVVVHAIKFCWQWGLYSQARNVDVILPLGMANYLDVTPFFSHQMAIYLALLITILTVMAFFRKGPKWLYMLVMILLHLQHVIRYSQGEIPHSQNLIGMSVLCLAIGAFFFPGKHAMPRFVMGSIIFFIGLGYTSAFFSKLIGTGIHWADGRHLWLWISEKSIDILSREGAYHPNFLQNMAWNSIPLATVILVIGWVTELAGFTLWWRKCRPYTATLLIFLHVGITLTMNIRFDAFVMQLFLVGFPWYMLIDRWAPPPLPGWFTKLI